MLYWRRVPTDDQPCDAQYTDGTYVYGTVREDADGLWSWTCRVLYIRHSPGGAVEPVYGKVFTQAGAKKFVELLCKASGRVEEEPASEEQKARRISAKLLLERFAAERRVGKTNRCLVSMKRRLEKMLSLIDEAEAVRYTGYYALMQFGEDGRPKCMGVVHADEVESDEEHSWDLILPIPGPDSVPEFDGW